MKKRGPTAPVCLQIDYQIWNKVRKILFMRRCEKKKPWSQNDAVSEALKEWLERNPK